MCLLAVWGKLQTFFASHYYAKMGDFVLHTSAECLALRGYNVPKMVFAYDSGGKGGKASDPCSDIARLVESCMRM